MVAALGCDPGVTLEEYPELPGIMVSVLDGLRGQDVSGAEYVRRISRAFPDGEWAQTWLLITDQLYNTILHTVFEGDKPDAVLHILSACLGLADSRNNYGYTPTQWAGFHMELTRTYNPRQRVTFDCSDSYKGFEYNALQSFAAMKGIEIANIMKLTDDDIGKVWPENDEANRGSEAALIRTTLRMKYGCTCGACIHGFLSPRMHFTLLAVTKMIEAFLDSGLPSQSWESLSGDATRSLPRVVRLRLAQYKTLRQGFVEMYRRVFCCLAEYQLPTETNIKGYCGSGTQESRRITRSYLRNGGKVGAVVMSIIEASMVWDEWIGNGLPDMDSLKGIDELPACCNDHEFEFVSGMCGYKRKYYHMWHWWYKRRCSGNKGPDGGK